MTHHLKTCSKKNLKDGFFCLIVQAVAAAHALYHFPASKPARSNMASFEHAWHVELDQLMSALKGMGPLDQGKEVFAFFLLHNICFTKNFEIAKSMQSIAVCRAVHGDRESHVVQYRRGLYGSGNDYI